jgi:hypothetical protein
MQFSLWNTGCAITRIREQPNYGRFVALDDVDIESGGSNTQWAPKKNRHARVRPRLYHQQFCGETRQPGIPSPAIGGFATRSATPAA